MEIKVGDKFILPMALVVNDVGLRGYVAVKDTNSHTTTVVRVEFLKQGRKVLGLLGDEGLEPKVGMKIECSIFGEGEIVMVERDEVSKHPVSRVRFGRALNHNYNHKGKPRGFTFSAKRTLYVTELPPEEPKGYAWVRNKDGLPYTALTEVTKKEAEENFGDDLIHWIPE